MSKNFSNYFAKADCITNTAKLEKLITKILSNGNFSDVVRSYGLKVYELNDHLSDYLSGKEQYYVLLEDIAALQFISCLIGLKELWPREVLFKAFNAIIDIELEKQNESV